MRDNLKNIIFDVGDVLLEYRWQDMMMDHGLTEEESLKLGDMIFNNNLWNILDLGTMSHDEVVQEYARLYPEHAKEITWFLNHGEQMVVNRPDVWSYIPKLRAHGYKVYLLSNYSENLFMKHTKDADFMNNIDGKVVSYEIHKTKPDPAIYQYLLTQYGLKAEEGLFFDDRKDNTAAAVKQGIEAITVTSKEQLKQELQELLK